MNKIQLLILYIRGSNAILKVKVAHDYALYYNNILQSNSSNLPTRLLRRLWYEDGWSGGAMVLGKLPVPGRPTNLD